MYVYNATLIKELYNVKLKFDKMSRDSERIERRNTAVYKKYKSLYDVKRKRHDDVLKELADEFFLAPGTIQKIILHHVKSTSHIVNLK